MSQRRKPTYRKTSASVASSSQPTSRSNSDIQDRMNGEESFQRTIFSQVSTRIATPQSHDQHDVAKGTVTDEDELMEISAPSRSQIRFEYKESNLTIHQRQQLKLITKYTSAQHNTSDQQALSPAADVVTLSTDNEAVVRRKNKRSLSPLRESAPERDESKRAKSTHRIEEAQQEPVNSNNNVTQTYDDDDEEISELLDQRRARRMSLNQSQKANQTPQPNGTSSGSCTTRKPTVRRTMSNQRYSALSSRISFSQPTPSPVLNNLDVLEIVLDDDDDEPRAEIPLSPNRTNPPPISAPDHLGASLSSTPSKPSLDSLILHKTHPAGFSTPIAQSTTRDDRRSSFNVSLRNNAPTPNDSPPEKSERGNRRCSSISSSSLIYDTPSSSLSRTTTTISQTTPLSSPIRRSDVPTDMNDPLVREMIVALIEQCGLNQTDGQDKIDFDPKELASELFQQSLLSKSDPASSTAKPQNLRFGKFEIEVLCPTDQDEIRTIYVCDLCFKHFHGSAMASQRHAAKCLLLRPPGELVFAENDLAIFQIGERKMTTEQRLYIESLHRVVRLFDASDLNEAPHYILCRRDPVLSPLQPYIYRFIGYFARSFDPSASKPVDNFSCLFILPPYAHHPEYNQLLITYSYFLLRSQRSNESHFSSPERPLNRTSLGACLQYWCQTVLDHLFQRIGPTISLETLARETFLHPRDVLFSLYFNRFIRSHPTDSSMIYLLKSAQEYLKANRRPRKRSFAFRTIHLPETNRNNDDRRFEEIVLD